MPVPSPFFEERKFFAGFGRAGCRPVRKGTWGDGLKAVAYSQ